MKVKELIKQLEKLNTEAEVILSSDAEGNSFHVLDEVSGSSKEGLFWDFNNQEWWSAEDETPKPKGAKPAVIFYPC